MKIFLDTNTLRSLGKLESSGAFQQLCDVVTSSLCEMVSTDITVKELAAHHAKSAFSNLKHLGTSRVQELARDRLGIELPALGRTEIFQKLFSSALEDAKIQLERADATFLEVNGQHFVDVLEHHFRETGPFSAAKQNQFKDAFVFQALTDVASEDSPVLIVSPDDDFVKACDGRQDFISVNNLRDLFTRLIPDQQSVLPGSSEAIFTEALEGRLFEEISDWGFIADDTSDETICLEEISETELMQLTTFRDAENQRTLVFARVKLQATFNYSHPDWDTAAYDSEDKTLYPWDTVNGELHQELTFDVASIMTDFEVEDTSGEATETEITEFQILHDRTLVLTLHPEPYPL